MYFSNFKNTVYEINSGEFLNVKDITTRMKFKSNIIDNIDYYDYYNVKSGETPEIVAYKLYGNTEYHWIILIANDIIDPKTDWPLSEVDFEKYLTDKYGDGIHGIHHYVNSKNLVVDPTYPLAVPVSNYEYEVELNDRKRDIRIPKKQMLDYIVDQFKKLAAK